ncbi:NAD-dependent epimerase/dehydratase family protein [Spongiactinospora sp. TRM90649]|uniref:NAD-dependent epimerase/dehydratase family protein n=1 Tax=Spongiactinospora sp. TRM90649 TaxID=3031114 RepID=UPI0023FA1495|nr:NAD-dependent epimerase/dehydratase family protein [Spongiactinospora sp. TRM90649]MDF5759025.1 NAD-dependent epimerase/dehydratase family protein [Spongiactinospora sp. TRM90649]
MFSQQEPIPIHHEAVRILVLGGSWFVGRAVVREALRRGEEVTLFNRGRSIDPPAGARLVRGDWERLEDLDRLAARGPWDVVVDVAGAVPVVVRNTARALSQAVGRYVFVSTISVYRDWPYQPVDETAAQWDGDPDFDPGTRHWDPDAYGPLKVGGELAIRREFGDSALFIRPHVILGPGEYVGRLPWWLKRVERGGAVLAPAPANRYIQPVDVRDVARFTLDLVTANATGAFNVATPIGRDTYGDLLQACRDATGSTAEFVWVDEAWLAERGVREWTEIPIWRTLPTAWAMNTDKARQAGLVCRPLRETVADTWRWMREGGVPVAHERAAEHGMSAERESELLRVWQDSRRGP